LIETSFYYVHEKHRFMDVPVYVCSIVFIA